MATWRPDVYYAADPAHGGVERPTLFGRVYLFGPELGFPMTGDGKLVVDLYEGAVPHGATGTPLEEWRFDPATLKGLLKRDMIGWGYTIPLPWSTYRADVTTVVLKARYEPTKGAPLFAEGRPDGGPSSGPGNRRPGRDRVGQAAGLRSGYRTSPDGFSSFPDSAWERATCEALPRVHSAGGSPPGRAFPGEPGNERQRQTYPAAKT